MFNLTGSIVALVTPMKEDGSICWKSLSELINWHINSGTSAIVVVGTTGESATLDVSEHVQVIEQCVQYSSDEIPIIAGTGANSTREAIYLTSAAKEAGAKAALLVTPYYNRPTQEGLVKHYEAISSEVDLPQILYNVPSRTACDLLPETIAILSDNDNIVGLKEASKDISRIRKLKQELEKRPNGEDFLLYSGDDTSACNFLSEGGHGIISVTANVIPDKIAKICDLSLKGFTDKAVEEDNKLNDLHQALFLETSPIPVKWILNRLGRIPNGIRLPLTELNPRYHKKIELIIEKHGLLK